MENTNKCEDIILGNLPVIYKEPQDWERLLFYYEAALSQVQSRIQVINKEFQLSNNYTPIERITTRIKNPDSIVRKLSNSGYDLTLESVVKHINDVAGIRIVCSFTSDIYEIAAFIMAQEDINVLKIKDYITCPKANGYMSYHMIISIPVHLSESVVCTKVEIQIRTIAMDFWASLEHKMYYKFEGKAPEHIRRDLKDCADIAAFLDRKMLSINEEILRYKVDPVEDAEVDEVALVSEFLGVIIEEN